MKRFFDIILSMQYLTELSLFIAIFLMSYFLSMFLNPFAIEIAKKFKILDLPNIRKIHSDPTPRWGGGAIFTAFIITILIFPINSPITIATVVGGVIIFIAGFIDDLKGLRPIWKLFFQIIAATCFELISGVTFSTISLPFIGITYFSKIVAYLLGILWITGVINAFNLIDGLDGLASGLALIALGGLIFTVPDKSILILAIALAGSILGFILFNYPPAMEFMGDTGALFIGYIIGTLTLAASGKTYTFFSIFLPLSLILIPVLDITWAFTRRILNGGNPFQADKLHIHHRLLMINFEKREVLVLLLLSSAIIALMGIFFSMLKSLLILVSLLILASGFIIFILSAYDYFRIPQLLNDLRVFLEKLEEKKSTKTKPVILEALALTLIGGYYGWIIWRVFGLQHFVTQVDLVFLLIILGTSWITYKFKRKIGVVLFMSGIFLLFNFIFYLLKLPDFPILYAKKDIILLIIALFLIFEIFHLLYIQVLIPYPEDVLFLYFLTVATIYMINYTSAWWTLPVVTGIMYTGVKLFFIKADEWFNKKEKSPQEREE